MYTISDMDPYYYRRGRNYIQEISPDTIDSVGNELLVDVKAPMQHGPNGNYPAAQIFGTSGIQSINSPWEIQHALNQRVNGR